MISLAAKDPPMSPWLEGMIAKYGFIWIGLTFGFAAKYALLIKKGVPIRLHLVLADILLLPMVALIAYAVVSRMGISGEMAALASGFCMVGADRLVKLLTDRFFKEVETEIEQVAERVRGQVRQEVQSERSGARIIEDTITGKAPDQYKALRRPPPKPDGGERK